MAVGFKQYDLLMHPAFRRLLDKMWQQFGRFWAIYQLGVNFVYIVMWTVIGIVVEYDKRHEYNLPDDAWRIVLYLLGVAFTLYQITDEFLEFRRSERMHTYWEQSRKANIQDDMKYCHPRWPEEQKYLEMEMGALEKQRPKYFHDMWNIFDWICYIMLIVCIATHIADIISHTELVARAHIRLMAVTIILLWLRLMKNARAFALLGPFIVMLGHMLKDCLRFLFLYLEFYIPYLAAFWMTYGGTKKVQADSTEEITVSGFEFPGQIFYSVFRMTLVDNYDYDNMIRIDAVMADILMSTWLLLSAVLSLNLFIALLSDTFQRVYDNAQANAVMQRAITILNIWEGVNSRRRNNFLLFIDTFCSPLKEEYDDDLTLPEDDDLKKVTVQIKEDLDNFQEMFKLQFGDPRSVLSENAENKNDSSVNKSSTNNDPASLKKYESELLNLRESLRSVAAQQETTTALLQKDMSLIKSMLRELLDKNTGGLKIYHETVSESSPLSVQTQLVKMRKKKKRSTNAGLDIDVIDGSAQSTTHDTEPWPETSEFSPAVFQDTTRSADAQVFGVNLPPPARKHQGTDSTNC